MEREVVRRTHALVRHQGLSRTTRTVAFECRSWAWADLPQQTRALAPEVDVLVADWADEDGELYQADDEVVRVLRGWRADRSGLYVAAAWQPVRLVGDRVVDAGPLGHLWVRRHQAATQPGRRLGLVPAGAFDPARSDGSSGGAAPLTPSAPPEQASAASAWPYLPAMVRDTAERAVPLPEDWLGSLTQARTPRGGLPRSQKVVMLRRSAGAAVVVRAERELPPRSGRDAQRRAALLADLQWTVEQVVYSLREPALIGPPAPRDEWPWR